MNYTIDVVVNGVFELTGKVSNIRIAGKKAMFVDLEDSKGKIRLYFREDATESFYSIFCRWGLVNGEILTVKGTGIISKRKGDTMLLVDSFDKI